MEPIGLAGQRRALLGQLCALLAGGPKCRALGWAAGRGNKAPANAGAGCQDASRRRARGGEESWGMKGSVYIVRVVHRDAAQKTARTARTA